MLLTTVSRTEHRLAEAWYVKYPLDTHALGPYRFEHVVSAIEAIAEAQSQFGERPAEVWPDGPVTEVPEYNIQLDALGVRR